MVYLAPLGLIWYQEERLVHVPLESVQSKVTVRGFIAHQEATLRYRNDGSDALQAVFRCPVDESSAVYKVEAKVDDRVIVGSCLEKKKAEEVYKTAVAEGKTALIVREESQTADVISLTLGNLPPNCVTEVSLFMVTELRVASDGGVQYSLPTVLNPRYCPADNPGQDQMLVQDYEPMVMVAKPYSIEVSASVTGSQTIARVVSHTDPISVKLEDDGALAEISQNEGFKSDHDWSFVVYYNNPYTPHLLIETGDRTNTGIMKDQVIMVNMFPELPEGSYSHRNEVIFVVDRSGSMMGENIQSARAVLLLFLKSLPPGCFFNVISFGSSFSMLFPKSREYSEASLSEACQLHAEMEADMGGTEIMEPLRSVYRSPAMAGYSRQMLLLTDGAVFNVDQMCSLVSRNSGDTRVFAVGIGEGASTALVKGVAKAGGGRAEMIQQRDRMQAKVMGLVASMLQSSVRDVKFSWELETPTRLSLVPPAPPVIFAGQHLTSFARIPATAVIKGVTISGLVEGVEMKSTVRQSHIKTVHDAAYSLHRLAARAAMRHHQMEDMDDAKEAVVELSVNTGVLSRYTALVAVDQDGKIMARASSEQTAVFVPGRYLRQRGGGSGINCAPMMRASPQFFKKTSRIAAAPQSGSGTLRCLKQKRSAPRPQPPAFGYSSKATFGSAAPMPQARSAGLTNALFANCSQGLSDTVDGAKYEALAMCGELDVDGFAGRQVEANKVPSKDEVFMELVEKQKFDGSWSFEDIASTLRAKLEDFQNYKTQVKQNDAVLATALALSVLNKCFGDRKLEWSLLGSKANRFLQGCCAEGSSSPSTDGAPKGSSSTSTDGAPNLASITQAADQCLAELIQKYPEHFKFGNEN